MKISCSSLEDQELVLFDDSEQDVELGGPDEIELPEGFKENDFILVSSKKCSKFYVARIIKFHHRG